MVLLKKLTLLSLPIYLLSNQFDITLQNELEWLEEETFVVSSSRVKENIKKTSASIVVIEAEEIEKMGLNSLSDVLNTITGMGVTQSNIYVKEIESRGIKDFTSKQILFMIDGHSLDSNLINGGSTSTFDMMSLENIKKIEIIKGPASALYGANAFTALINIITKNANDINALETKIKVGSFNTKEVNILFGKSYDNLDIVANLNIFDNDGNKVFIRKDSINKNGDNNPFSKRIKADLKLNYKNYYYRGSFFKREDGPHFGPSNIITDESNAKNKYFYSEIGYALNYIDNLNINTKLYYDNYSFDNTWELYPKGYSNGTYTYANGMKTINKVTNTKLGIESLATYKVLTNYSLSLGGMYEKHKQFDVETIQNFDPITSAPLSSMTDFSNTNGAFTPNVSRSMWAAYLNNLYDINSRVRLTFGIRYDKYSDFGSNFAKRGGLAYLLNNETSLKLMYGEGFRAPTFAELHNKSNVISGDSTLKAEKVKTYELSLDSKIKKNIDYKITLFHNDFKNLIVLDAQKYLNRGETQTRGIEFESKYSLNRGSFFRFNYTFQEAKDESTNNELANIPKHKANIFFNYRISKNINLYNHLYLKGKVKRISEDNRDSMKAYAIFNTSMIFKNIFKNMQLKTSINNIFDKKYYDPSLYKSFGQNKNIDDYLNDGRTFYVEVKYKF